MGNKVIANGVNEGLQVGMIFRCVRDDEFYILCRNEDVKYSLVCLNDGKTWDCGYDEIEGVFRDYKGLFERYIGELTIVASCEE